MKSVKPVRDYVLVRRLKKEDVKSESGIILSAKSSDIFDRCEVLEVSDGFYQNGQWCEMLYDIGDILLVPEKQGENIFIDAEQLYLVRETQIWAKVTL